jgi:hypothetical protein
MEIRYEGWKSDLRIGMPSVPIVQQFFSISACLSPEQNAEIRAHNLQASQRPAELASLSFNLQWGRKDVV